MNEIKSEYFELVKLLNKSNKTKDEMTKLFFYVDDSNRQHLKLYAALSIDQKIILCEKKSPSGWMSSGFTPFTQLENYLAITVVEYKLENFTKLLLTRIFELPD